MSRVLVAIAWCALLTCAGCVVSVDDVDDPVDIQAALSSPSASPTMPPAPPPPQPPQQPACGSGLGILSCSAGACPTGQTCQIVTPPGRGSTCGCGVPVPTPSPSPCHCDMVDGRCVKSGYCLPNTYCTNAEVCLFCAARCEMRSHTPG